MEDRVNSGKVGRPTAPFVCRSTHISWNNHCNHQDTPCVNVRCYLRPVPLEYVTWTENGPANITV